MTRVSRLADLYRHMEWADAQLWKAVRGAAVESFDPRLFQLLHHMHSTQHAFLLLWKNEPIAIPSQDELHDCERLQEWARSYHEAVRAWLDRVTESILDQPFQVPWSRQLESKLGAPPHPTLLEDTAYQVIAHSTYHRAQINTRLRELGSPPPLLDYIAWIWMGRPSASWPEAGRSTTLAKESTSEPV